MIKWSIDPRDWERLDAGQVTAAVLEAAAPEQIILLHDIYPTSVDAALAIVDALQAEGYRFVTVEELLKANGIQPEAGVLYCSGEEARDAGSERGGEDARTLRRPLDRRTRTGSLPSGCLSPWNAPDSALARISRISVRIRNTAPTHLVARASLASQVLALLRERKESATPPMAPDRPALLPDWKSTTTMIARPQSSCRIVMTSVKAPYGITSKTFSHARHGL